MPLNFNPRCKPLKTFFVAANVGMLLPILLLFLLPLHRVILCLVFIHLSWIDTSPPNTLLVLTQLTFPTPLLRVDLTNVELYIAFVSKCEFTSVPSAGITNTKVDGFDMLL